VTKRDEPKPVDPIRLKEFLETTPPGRTVSLHADDIRLVTGPTTNTYLTLPEISLHCGSPLCDRFQLFKSSEKEKTLGYQFVSFTCKNCSKTVKIYALAFFPKTDGYSIYKFGETPPFGPPLPAKLLQLAGEYGELLKKGRQSENQSLGIGAFAYYRRVVELQKSRLIDELVNAIKRLGGNSQALETLEEARGEQQFSKALELMADVTPKEVFVSGQNPLKLLHGPLSVGLHGMTDEECLTKAHSIRVVMGALLERIQMITEAKSELDAAIKDLLPNSGKAIE
jgi:hypothetical protein